MPNQSLLSREAETTIQNIIRDLSSGVEPSIRKASSAYGALDLPLDIVLLAVSYDTKLT